MQIITITAIAIDSEYDIIIGREFIKQYNLVKLFPTYFCSDKFLSEVITLCQASVNETFREIPQQKIVSNSTLEVAERCQARSETSLEEGLTSANLNMEVDSRCQARDDTTIREDAHISTKNNFRENKINEVVKSFRLLLLQSHNHTNQTSRKPLSAYEREDISEISDDALESVPTELILTDSSSNNQMPTRIHGSATFQTH